MDPLTVAGWGLVYAGIGSLVARMAYRWLRSPAYDGYNSEDSFLAFTAMLLWPIVVLAMAIVLFLELLALLVRVLAASLTASWQWWLRD